MSQIGEPDLQRHGYRILVVDDEPDVLQVVRFSLEKAGHRVTTASSAREALAIIESDGFPHLAIVDIMMPQVDGFALSRQIQQLSALPIVMLTAVNEEETVVQAIREVAEDYVTKPFRPNELVARVERILRRFNQLADSGPRLAVDDQLTLDLKAKRAELAGVEIELTPMETRILDIMTRRIGQTVTTGYLLRRLWPREEVFEDSLRVHVHHLRRKIEPVPKKPRYLKTVRGTGYVFEANPSS